MADKVPVLLMIPLLFKVAKPCEERMMSPPGAKTAFPLSTNALIEEGSTRTLTKVLRGSNCNSKSSPAASATVPSFAIITPLLRTSGASRAT